MSGAAVPAAPAPLRRREQRRRRAVMLAITGLLLLGMSPIVGHHLGSGIDRLLAGTDHLGALCLIALHHLLDPVHDLFHGLLLAGVSYAAWDRLRAGRTLRRTLAALPWRTPAPGSALEAAAREAGVDPRRVRAAPGLPLPAFTAGWLRPRIYVAQELAERLGRDELVAVLMHEGAHAARRDPLRLSVLRFLGHALFWIPVLRRLAEDCADEAEIRADDAAARDRPLVLASALVALAGWRTPDAAPAMGVGINRRDLLDRRVRRLAGEEVHPETNVTRRSIAGASAMLLLVWATGTAMVHPLPAEHGGEAHCDHGRPAWTHLFCRGETVRAGAADCPHGRR
ncbi:MAG TPA: M56 family metallopeptidase [Longimicrobiaceae bacterium]|nr:M56 family metallopeptidase [Longimicrobiaceae bacterium]